MPTTFQPPAPWFPPAPWLPPIPGLHRRDPEHRYYLGGVSFPISVTGVLAVTKSDYAMKRIEATREAWEPRGNTAHRALELFLIQGAMAGQPSQGIPFRAHGDELLWLAEGEWGEWVHPLVGHPRWESVQVIASERPTCCRRRRIAGTFDCAYLDPSLLPSPERPAWVTGPAIVLADLKSLSAHGSTYSTAAQLGGYMALEASHGLWYDWGQTIWARPGATTFSPLHSRQDCRLAWAAAWATYKAVSAMPKRISL